LKSLKFPLKILYQKKNGDLLQDLNEAKENSNNIHDHEEFNEKYSKLFLEEINFLRKNINLYAEKIKKLKDSIVIENGEYFLLSSHGGNFPRKSRLWSGEKAFEETLEILKKKENLKLPDFEHIEDLRIPFPYDNITLSKKSNYVKSKFHEIQIKLKEKYEVSSHHFEISFKDVEFSLTLQLIDDNNSNKKRLMNLLSEEHKYIGITCGEIGKDRINVYMLFAK